jgi:hypothetical protein
MSGVIWLLGELVMLSFGVLCLLTAYRRIGKPEGADPKYDAHLRQMSGTYKVLGWGWVVSWLLALIGTLLTRLS